MKNINFIKNFIFIQEKESKLNKNKNTELNINLNNFLISKIFPDIIFLLVNGKSCNIEKNTDSYTIIKTENKFSINSYSYLEDFLFESYTNKDIEYSSYIIDIEDYLIKKHKNYFSLILKNLLKEYFNDFDVNSLFNLFLNKIQRLKIDDIFFNNLNQKENLYSIIDNNDNFKEKKKDILLIINSFCKNEDIQLKIKSDFNDITIKLKSQQNEINDFIIEELLNKFFNSDFYFFIKHNSKFKVNNKKIEFINGYSFINQETLKLNKKQIIIFNLKNFSNHKVIYQ